VRVVSFRNEIERNDSQFWQQDGNLAKSFWSGVARTNQNCGLFVGRRFVMLANKMATNSQPYNCLTVVKQNCGSDRKRFAMLANKMATQSQTYKSNTDEA